MSRLPRTAARLQRLRRTIGQVQRIAAEQPAVPTPDELAGLDETELARMFIESLRRLEAKAKQGRS